MKLTPRLRKLALTGHVTFSVGWLGAVLAYLAIAITALATHDPVLAGSAYPTLELIGWYVLVPCSVAALSTGLLQSLATEWGLFRHYWIVAKLFLTVIGTVILLSHMPTVSRVSAAAQQAAASGVEIGAFPVPLVVHAAGGLVVLLTATVLSIYKPWGRTSHGRKLSQRAA